MAAPEFDYRFVSLRDISRPAYLRVWAGHFFARARARIFPGGPARFDRLAARLLARPDPRGFALPVPLAVRDLGPALELAVPARALAVNMYPWVIARGRARRVSHFFLGEGDWRPLLFPFSEGRIYREMGELIAAGENFADTAVYRELADKARAGRPERRNAVHLADPGMIDEYFRRYLGLAASIRERGMVRLRDLPADPVGGGAVRRCVSDWTEADIGVGLDRDGNLVRLPDAQHRSAIAVHLDLAVVPVELRMVHGDWLRRQLERFPGMPPSQALLAGVAEVRSRLSENASATRSRQ